MKNSTIELKNQAKALTNQISRMDRNFIHQNFFRILEQHFKTRDRLNFEDLDYDEHPLSKSKKVIYSGENSFTGLLKFLLSWVDDKELGWFQNFDGRKPEIFHSIYGFSVVDRPARYKFSKIQDLKFHSDLPDFNGFNHTQIQFMFRVALHERNFDTYIRSMFYLLNYIKTNDLKQYYLAVEAGMGNHERIFMFYFLTTQFELHGQKDLKDWLMENDFLFSIKGDELLDPLHKSLLYPKDGYLPIAHIIT